MPHRQTHRARAKLWAAACAVLLNGCGVSFLAVGSQRADAGSADVGPADGGCGSLCLDPTFAEQGARVIDGQGVRSLDFSPQALALQPDGKIVLGGVAAPVSGEGLAMLAVRLELSGAFDSTFGTGGRALASVGVAQDLTVEAVAVQPDGRILLAGTRNPGVGAVVRLQSDGALDPAFGEHQGYQLIDQMEGAELVNGLAVLADGRIRLGGQCWRSATVGTSSDLCAWGLTAAGRVDSSFQAGAGLAIDFAGGAEYGGALLADPDGNLLLPGTAWTGGGFDAALARIDAGGALVGFGKLTSDFAGGRDEANAVAVQRDGRLIAVGTVTGPDGTVTDFGLARYLANGALDATFGSAGRLTIDLGGDDAALALVMLDDERIVVGGSGTPSGHGDTDFALLTLLPDGTPDERVGPGGVRYYGLVPGRDEQVHAMAVDRQGRLLVYGSIANGNGNDPVLMRLLP